MLTSPAAGPRLADRGFTLIELMVTLALLAFLLLLGLPAFTAMVKNTQVRTVADALQNGLRIARAEALRTNQQTVFALTSVAPGLNVAEDPNGTNWWVQTIPHANGGSASAVQNGSGSLTDVASGVSIMGGPAVLCFNSNGRLTDLGGASPGMAGGTNCSVATNPVRYTISQSRADLKLQVLVSVGGQVRLCDLRRAYSATSAPDGCPP